VFFPKFLFFQVPCCTVPASLKDVTVFSPSTGCLPPILLSSAFLFSPDHELDGPFTPGRASGRGMASAADLSSLIFWRSSFSELVSRADPSTVPETDVVSLLFP